MVSCEPKLTLPSHRFHFLYLFTYLFLHVYVGVYVEVRGQLTRVRSLLPRCGSQGLDISLGGGHLHPLHHLLLIILSQHREKFLV